MSLGRVETKTTTVRIPVHLYDQAKDLICEEKSAGAAVSLNEVIVSALKVYVKIHARRKIDEAFSRMAEDADYQKESALLAEEFEHSDWESLVIGEDMVGDSANDASRSR